MLGGFIRGRRLHSGTSKARRRHNSGPEPLSFPNDQPTTPQAAWLGKGPYVTSPSEMLCYDVSGWIKEREANLSDRQRDALAALDNATEEFSSSTEEFLDPELVIMQPRGCVQLLPGASCHGRTYLEAIGPVKAAFEDREYPADFDEKLAALIADFDGATEDTDAGLQGQSGGTAGLRVVSQRG